MFQRTDLNLSRIPARREQITPGPDAVGNAADVTTLQTDVTALQGDVSTLSSQVGSLVLGYRVVTATGSLLVTDRIVGADASGASITLTLPAAADADGITITVKVVATAGNTVTVDAAGSETIDGAASVSSSTQWAVWSLYSNGVEWLLI